jgi:hypothetical protein
MYVIYVDDSGDSTFRTYTALAIPVARWTSYLKGWLTFRKQLFRDDHVPADYELHAYKWLSAHPDPMDEILDAQPPILQQGRDHRRDRSKAFERGIKIIGTFEDARLFTVASETIGVHDLYGRLVRWLDEWLGQEGTYGLVIIDGEDQGLKYRRRHRDLGIRTRRIIEDPQPMPSHESQLIQMADWCAYSVYRHLLAERAVNPEDEPRDARHFTERLHRLHIPDEASIRWEGRRPRTLRSGACLRANRFAPGTGAAVNDDTVRGVNPSCNHPDRRPNDAHREAPRWDSAGHMMGTIVGLRRNSLGHERGTTRVCKSCSPCRTEDNATVGRLCTSQDRLHGSRSP